MAVHIVVDSSCDLPGAEARAAGITIIPVLVRIGAQTFRDGVDISLTDFYARLNTAADLPSTMPPPVSAYEDAFKSLGGAGSEIICLTVSAKVSGIYENAQAAAGPAGSHVHVFDSRTLSGGLGLLATGAARLARSGADASTILAALEKWRENQHGFAAYPDLKFLAKSGRINKAQMALGLMMKVFPVTRISRSGEMEGETTVKSWEQAKETLASAASRKMERPASMRVAITHTNAPELGEYIAQGLRTRLTVAPKELKIYSAGPTVAANVGPGAGGVFILEE